MDIWVAIILIAIAVSTAYSAWKQTSFSIIVSATCIFVFMIELIADSSTTGGILSELGFRPGDLTDPARSYTLLTSMYTHAGFSHLFWNLLGLIFIGMMFEQRIGARPFILLYFLSGLHVLPGDTDNMDPLAARLRTTPTRYEGPTGIVGALNDACRRAELPVVSVWASVPHYVSEVSNPHAVLALVRRVLDFLEWDTDLGELEAAAAEFDRQLSRIVSQKPEVARYIEELERRDDKAETSEGESSGDAPGAAQLIREVEQFLREHRRETGQN